MKKKTESNGFCPPALAECAMPLPCDPFGEGLYPILMSLMMPKYHEGKLAHEGATISVRAVGSTWLVTIHCPSEHRTLTMQLGTMADFFAAVEDCLVRKQYAYDLDWKTKKRHRQALDKPVL